MLDERLIFTFDAEIVAETTPKGTWYLLFLPKEAANEIRFFCPPSGRGWGSIPVEVTVGGSCWHTSIFPHKKSAGYLMLVKAEIRKKENLAPGATFTCCIKTR